MLHNFYDPITIVHSFLTNIAQPFYEPSFSSYMKNIITAFWLCSAIIVSAQSSKNVQFIGQLPYTKGLSDIWGYVANDGTEYALVGVYDGVSVVNLSNPAQPKEEFFITGPGTIWRDIKVHKDFAYVTNESANSQGLLVMDLRYLPDSLPTHHWNGDSSRGVTFAAAHNIFIDEKGYGYIVGADYGQGGAIIADLNSQPGQPILKTVYDQNYIHDIYVRGDTMWTAEIYRGWFAVVDIADKSQPTVPASKVMATQTTPFNFTHNLWLSEDGNTLFTTDERSDAPVAAYDVSDLSNIQYLDEVRSNPGSGVIPHNTFVDSTFVVTAYYRDGLQVVDASEPDNLIETGHYDTSPMAGDGFNGAWGLYPYLPSGLYLISDIEEGLFVLQPEFVKAARLQGVVRDTFTQAPLFGATVQLIAGKDTAASQTNLLGQYKNGLADSGSIQLRVEKVGYYSKTIQPVILDNGVTITQNVDLKPLPSFSVDGVLTNAVTGQPIPVAEVVLVGEDTTFSTQTNGQGAFDFGQVFVGDYTLIAGKWGFQSRSTQINLQQNTSIAWALAPGYYDDFALPFGWSAGGDATSGEWTRAEPVGTYLNPNVLFQPEEDVTTDIGFQCFVTGNAGLGVGDDDVDGGAVVLTSPRFNAANMQQPIITFQYWFVSALGAGNPNDSLLAVLDNGTTTDTFVIATPAQANNFWSGYDIDIRQHLSPTANMTFQLITSDLAPGHVVEAAIDDWSLTDAGAVPTALFDAQTRQGCAPLSVQYTSLSTGVTDSLRWYSPGSVEDSATGTAPVFTYAFYGQYDVTLLATNSIGTDTLKKTNYIEVFDPPNLSTGVILTAGKPYGMAVVYVIGGNGPFTYAWSDSAQQTNDTATGLVPGQYIVTVTDANGCQSSDTVTVPLSTSVDGFSMNTRQWEVFPNPVTPGSQLITDAPLADPGRMVIMNNTGQQITSRTLATGQQQWRLPALPSGGMYWIVVTLADKRYVLPVIQP